MSDKCMTEQQLQLFVDRFGNYVKSGRCEVSDAALAHLLIAFRKQLPLAPNYATFIKLHRQVDVTDNGNVDMALWNLLNGSITAESIFNAVLQGEDDG